MIFFPIDKIIVYSIGFIFLLSSFFYLLTVWNVKKPKFENAYAPKVCVMAYAWQSGNVIERKIKNFLQQNYPKDKFEIVIYDNKSTDETKDICLKYKKQGLIKYFTPEKAYDRKAPVLDLAIKNVVKSEIIALTDPDSVCEKDWLKKIVQPFKDSKVGAVAGTTHCGNYYKNLFTKFRAIEDEWWYNIAVHGKNGKIKVSDFQPICGANYALRRAAWKSVGGSHGKTLIEDYEITHRLYDRGWKIAASDANLWQEEVEDVEQYARQRKRWYSINVLRLVKDKNWIDKSLGAYPISMQSMAFFSLIYFLIIVLNRTIQDTLTSYAIIYFIPTLFMYLALSYGLIKIGKTKFLPYVPLLLTFDSALQAYVFLETKTLEKEEQQWVMLLKGKYYHTGSKIKMD